MDKTQLKYKIVTEGVKNLLEEAKVPLKYHLKVVEALHKAFADHKKDREAHIATLSKVQTHLQGQATERELFKKSLTNYDLEVKRLHTLPHIKGERGEAGKPGADGIARHGKDGISPKVEDVVRAMLPYIPKPREGRDGKNAPGMEMDKIVEAVVKSLQQGDKLHISHVKGASGFIKDGIRYRYEELMHGGGSSTGGGITLITVTGTVDDSNVTFTATSQPTLLNINGGFYKSTGGSITWTYSGGTITLSSAVGVGGQIYGMK